MEKYSKIRQIGEGAFGKAILVKKKTDGKQFVMKEINIRKMSPKERQDSKKEVAVLAQLDHPNIVKYRESFEDAGNLFIVMDFCEKGDLYSKINSQRGILIPEEQVMDWFVQICLAIKHIHDRKILHRDIKSQNIFLSADGSLQLGDFGIAKVLGSTVELARTCIGTPYYLSPEIVENRPYNNKSDIWSLGCVLYELVTLKHAFEAGNMKNLVLKIIRGSYPPISPKYSYDMRGLIAQLFKRSPKDRPSINSILKKPFIQKRVSKFLSEEVIADEFSHTVMHGHKLGRALPPPPPSSRPPAAGRKITPARAPQPQKYNPANVYGAPLVRKSNEKRSSAEKKRPGSAGPSRPGSAASRPGSAQGVRPSNSNQDLKKKRQELIDKEKKRLEEKIEEKKCLLNEKVAAEKRHKDLLEKQKIARMNKAREEGWKGLMGSVGSDDGDKNVKKEVKDQPREQIRWPPPNEGEGDRGKYDQYHEYLDKMQKERDQRQQNPQPGHNPAAYMAAPRIANPPNPIPNWNRVPAPTPVYQPHQNRQNGNVAAERAKIVEDFVQRKREAALNKHRGQADIFGNVKSYEGQQQQVRPEIQRPGSARNREEQEYLEKLKQIRQQNLNDRRMVQGKQKNDDANMENAKRDAELRKKKIEALRQQADDRAKQLRDQLEKDRRKLFEKEKQLQEIRAGGNKDGHRPLPPKAAIQMKPAPAASITGALNAIGAEPPKPQPVASAEPAVGMTGVLSAIGAKSEKTEAKNPVQQQKDDILKRLNKKVTPRGKWGSPEKPEVEEEPPVSARSQWGEGKENKLADLPLEQTASQMEATSARDQVVRHPESGTGESTADKPQVKKRQWGGPSDTLINALKDKPIIEETHQSSEEVKSPEVSSVSQTSISATITISKPPKVPICKGTITISKDDKLEQNDERNVGSTITVDKPVVVQRSLSSEVGESTKQESENLQTENNIQSEPAKAADSQSESQDVQETKPVCVDKPPLPAKPVVLPKPVLLPKPDAPKQFEGSQDLPQAVQSQGAGSLFKKTENESKSSKSEDMKKEEVKEEKVKKGSGVILGITSGQFDLGNAQMLRTCSEPDLSKLTRTADFVEISKRSRKQSLDLEQLKDEDEAIIESLLANVNLEDDEDDSMKEDDSKPVSPLKLESQSPRDSSKEGEDADAEDESGDVCSDDEDYEDLLSVRETMQSLLLREYSTDEEKRESARLSLTGSKEKDIKEKGAEDNSEDESETPDDEKDEKDDDQDEENGQEEDDENEDDNNEDNEDEENPVNRSVSIDSENPSDPTSDLFQSDESDKDTQFGDDDDDFDLFSRLEESRAELETELGCEKFLKVYKTVQALQEDEDENIEEGAKLVTNILGAEKEHLYPKIFQLVMADAAFTEEQNRDDTEA